MILNSGPWNPEQAQLRHATPRLGLCCEAAPWQTSGKACLHMGVISRVVSLYDGRTSGAVYAEARSAFQSTWCTRGRTMLYTWEDYVERINLFNVYCVELVLPIWALLTRPRDYHS